MAITRQKKEQLTADYVDKIGRAELVIIADYRGLTVKQAQELRRSLASYNASFQVAKNTLLGRAIEESGKPVPAQLLEGPTAVGYCFGELPPAAKAITSFARTSNVLQIRGALLGSQIIDAEGVRALGDLPAREVLIAQVLAGLQSPIASLVNVLSGTVRGLVNVIEARRRQLEEPAA